MNPSTAYTAGLVAGRVAAVIVQAALLGGVLVAVASCVRAVTG